ncbi:hypothetical protein AK812_SmicGene41077 [Symbiodinium microadriaticum]|uniref:Uncharacterized protein n=1 Tax=Symbiodinium microadriaticum TaxID=2951 RepID=A0A1Q9C721_SYMMI|nr:hypothetical protein AK812_SmicGene41077 [Symbiodinium microadriaticum]
MRSDPDPASASVDAASSSQGAVEITSEETPSPSVATFTATVRFVPDFTKNEGDVQAFAITHLVNHTSRFCLYVGSGYRDEGSGPPPLACRAQFAMGSERQLDLLLRLFFSYLCCDDAALLAPDGPQTLRVTKLEKLRTRAALEA